MVSPFRILTAYLLMVGGCFAQRLSFGVIGGTALTPDFPPVYQSGPVDPFGNPGYEGKYFGGPRSFILGALLEAHLSDRFSVEANILHRPMKLRLRFHYTFPDGHTEDTDNTYPAVRAWEFPVMFKYTMPEISSSRLRPFIEAGPAFRTQEQANATDPSQFGFAAGAGLAFHFNRFRLAPTLRYTRWKADNNYSHFATKPDQVEFLTSLSYETGSGGRRIGKRKLEIGGIVGTAFTAGFADPLDTKIEETPYLAGLSLQIPIRGNVSLEGDLIYRPIQYKFRSGDPNTLLSWQFPILAKYRWTGASRSLHSWTPFAAAGPSFRVFGNIGEPQPSHYGVTAGGGFERLVHGFRLAPTLRYTRWQKDPVRGPRPANFPYTGTNPNSVEVMFAVSS